jgi:hypothetical protein
MMDWMIQVFRVLKLGSPQTYFTATRIMDRFFEASAVNGFIIDRTSLHQLGLVSVLISSKFEDVKPIRMNQILRDAGHSKFKLDEILEWEKRVLYTL